MGQLLVRALDDRIIDSLKKRAQRSGRSVEAEHRLILEQVLAPEVESFAETAARIRAMGPKLSTNTADVVRVDRDRDYPADL